MGRKDKRFSTIYSQRILMAMKLFDECFYRDVDEVEKACSKKVPAGIRFGRHSAMECRRAVLMGIEMKPYMPHDLRAILKGNPTNTARRSFYTAYGIMAPAGQKAKNGRWVIGPASKFFERVKDRCTPHSDIVDAWSFSPNLQASEVKALKVREEKDLVKKASPLFFRQTPIIMHELEIADELHQLLYKLYGLMGVGAISFSKERVDGQDTVNAALTLPLLKGSFKLKEP